VRAPTEGTLRAVLVKVDDTVTVGQVVAVLDEAASIASDKAAPTALPPRTSQTPPVDLEELTAAASEVSDSTMRGHKARIRFPPRRTPEGLVISAMPAVDQKKYIDRSASYFGTSKGVTGAANQGSDVLQALSEYIPRRTLADEEMEAIMLGGADP
jgi:pyruvate/2-oxoglutarate dehydrogenase complex dihydrolipoamide acyltransferase (E2) component